MAMDSAMVRAMVRAIVKATDMARVGAMVIAMDSAMVRSMLIPGGALKTFIYGDVSPIFLGQLLSKKLIFLGPKF